MSNKIKLFVTAIVFIGVQPVFRAQAGFLSNLGDEEHGFFDKESEGEQEDLNQLIDGIGDEEHGFFGMVQNRGVGQNPVPEAKSIRGTPATPPTARAAAKRIIQPPITESVNSIPAPVTGTGNNEDVGDRFALLKNGNYETEANYCPWHVETDPANHKIYLEALDGSTGCSDKGQTFVAQCAGEDAQNCPLQGNGLFLSVLPDGNFVLAEANGAGMAKYEYTASDIKRDSFSYSEEGYSSDVLNDDGGSQAQACESAQSGDAYSRAMQDCQNAGWRTCAPSTTLEPEDSDVPGVYQCLYTVTVKGGN